MKGWQHQQRLLSSSASVPLEAQQQTISFARIRGSITAERRAFWIVLIWTATIFVAVTLYSLQKLSAHDVVKPPTLLDKDNDSTLQKKRSWMIKEKDSSGGDVGCGGRKPIQYVVSFPKSGRTWLRFMLANYLRNVYLGKKEESLVFDDMFGLIPNQLCPHSPDRCTYQYCERDEVPMLVASHSPFDDPSIGFSFDRQRVVLLVRNVYDTLVSYYYHMNNTEPGRYNFKSFVEDQIDGYINHLNSYFNNMHRFTSTVVSYEHLRQNTTVEFGSVISFLGLKEDSSAIYRSINASSFENMLKMELDSKRSLNGVRPEVRI